jgi:predicted Rossmann-fold nucleotide-binding protein
MNITVYLGASKGNDNTLANAVRELGTWIGESGNSLVYGGSKSGLMGLQFLTGAAYTTQKKPL